MNSKTKIVNVAEQKAWTTPKLEKQLLRDALQGNNGGANDDVYTQS